MFEHLLIGLRLLPHVISRTWRVALGSSLFLTTAGCRLGDAQAPEAVLSLGVFRSDSTDLAYTLEWPAGPGPFPVVVLVHGSGRTTRDEMQNIFARFLSRGFAVFRYDKRGVGASGGTYQGVGPLNSPRVIPQLARDAVAAFRTACAAPRIDRSRCGYFGASQAGWIFAEALLQVPEAAFTIVFSGTTVSVGREIEFSRVFEHGGGTLDSALTAMANYSGPEGYDPALSLARIRVPTLWLVGLADQSTPARVALQQLESLKAGGAAFTIRGYESYGHGLGPLIWPDIDVFLAPVTRR